MTIQKTPLSIDSYKIVNFIRLITILIELSLFINSNHLYGRGGNFEVLTLIQNTLHVNFAICVTKF